jgi:hypothetical protein
MSAGSLELRVLLDGQAQPTVMIEAVCGSAQLPATDPGHVRNSLVGLEPESSVVAAQRTLLDLGRGRSRCEQGKAVVAHAEPGGVPRTLVWVGESPIGRWRRGAQ